jgi:hypothetical protein
LDEPAENEGDFVLTADTLLYEFAELIWETMNDKETMTRG